MDQKLDVLDPDARTIEHRRCRNDNGVRDRWRRYCGTRWNRERGGERQDRRVVIINTVAVAGVTRSAVRFRVPMNRESVMPRVVGFMDVLRRSDRYPSDRCDKHESRDPTKEHACAS